MVWCFGSHLGRAQLWWWKRPARPSSSQSSTCSFVSPSVDFVLRSCRGRGVAAPSSTTSAARKTLAPAGALRTGVENDEAGLIRSLERSGPGIVGLQERAAELAGLADG